jgi:hypothetical protein
VFTGCFFSRIAVLIRVSQFGYAFRFLLLIAASLNANHQPGINKRNEINAEMCKQSKPLNVLRSLHPPRHFRPLLPRLYPPPRLSRQAIRIAISRLYLFPILLPLLLLRPLLLPVHLQAVLTELTRTVYYSIVGESSIEANNSTMLPQELLYLLITAVNSTG